MHRTSGVGRKRDLRISGASPSERVDSEIEHYLAERVDRLVEAGWDPQEARREAERRFGAVPRYRAVLRRLERDRWRRDRWRGRWGATVDGARAALRSAWRHPGFTLVAVLSLAVGIGANTAVFSVVNALLIRDLPFQAPHKVVNVYRDWAAGAFGPLSYPDFLEVQDGTRDVFAELGGFQYALAPRETGSGVETVVVEMVTGNYMPLLGIRADLGRTLLPEDDLAPGAHPVVVLGHRFWVRAFGADPQVLGRSVVLNGRSFTVVGVAPQSFPGSLRGSAADVFAPIMMIDALMPYAWHPLQSRGTNAFWAVGRLHSEVTLARAQSALDGVSRRLKATFAGTWDTGDRFRALFAHDVIVNPTADRIVVLVNLIAMGVVVVLLIIACTNLAAFLLARGINRRREVALKLALGATRGRVIGQLVGETLTLALVGATIGILLAFWILRLALGVTLPIPFPVGLDVRLDPTVLGFTAAVSLGTGLLAGLVPALQATRPDLVSTLKDGRLRGGGSQALAMGRFLVSAQMALAVVVLVVAGLFIRSLSASKLLDAGFGREPAAVLSFMVPADKYPRQEGPALLESVLGEVRATPGVTRVAAISNIHLNPMNSMMLDVNVDGVPAPAGREAHSVDFTSVSEGFFAAAGIPLLEGRDFGPSDREDAMPVAIVNEAMARRFWPQGGALGRTIHMASSGWRDRTVVGVVGTAKIHSLGEEPTPFMYFPFAQEWNAQVSVLAVSDHPQATAGSLFRLVRGQHPELVVLEARTLKEHIGVMLLFGRLSALLSSVFAALALGLSLMGLYGVVSHEVARRSREMGIRLSVGAMPDDLVVLQLRDGMRLVLIGAVTGLVLALPATRALAGILVGVSPLDPLAFAGAVGALAAVALLAAYFPAKRSSRIDPVEVLRGD